MFGKIDNRFLSQKGNLFWGELSSAIKLTLYRVRRLRSETRESDQAIFKGSFSDLTVITKPVLGRNPQNWITPMTIEQFVDLERSSEVPIDRVITWAMPFCFISTRANYTISSVHLSFKDIYETTCWTRGYPITACQSFKLGNGRCNRIKPFDEWSEHELANRNRL